MLSGKAERQPLPAPCRVVVDAHLFGLSMNSALKVLIVLASFSFVPHLTIPLFIASDTPVPFLPSAHVRVVLASFIYTFSTAYICLMLAVHRSWRLSRQHGSQWRKLWWRATVSSQLQQKRNWPACGCRSFFELGWCCLKQLLRILLRK